MRFRELRAPKLRRSPLPATTAKLAAALLLLVLLSATGGGLAVDAYRWRTEAPAAIRVLGSPHADRQETREAIVAVQFNVERAIDALKAAAARNDENAIHARNALRWIEDRSR